jgi:hypothetical protein
VVKAQATAEAVSIIRVQNGLPPLPDGLTGREVPYDYWLRLEWAKYHGERRAINARIVKWRAGL